MVDLDLERFFDRINHDILMSRVAARIPDKRGLKLIRAFLSAGVLQDGLLRPVDEGTPQGGPVSPFLSNIVLDDLARNWLDVVTGSAVTRMTATSMFAATTPAKG